jgi:hypothetical protein
MKWLKSIRAVNSTNKRDCVATVISDKHLLTAKDCVEGMKLTLRKQIYNPNSPILNIKRIIALKAKMSNIAVVELISPLTFDETTGPICLSRQDKRDYLDAFVTSHDHYSPSESNEYKIFSQQLGFPTSNKTHFSIRKDDKKGCPSLPQTQLFSFQDFSHAAYSLGTLHTRHAKDYCQSGRSHSVLYDNLSHYTSFFDKILVNAKTCPPFTMEKFL